jgi:hypothetical protein
MNKKKPDYRHCGLEKISAVMPKKEKDPAAMKKTAKRDLRVKGG